MGLVRLEWPDVLSSKKYNQWISPIYYSGTISALLQEIINIYPAINPPTLTAHQSNRVCNALALLQCVASHPDTRSVFLQVPLARFLVVVVVVVDVV